MRDPKKPRIDYTPGRAAATAIDEEHQKHPDFTLQAVIDRLVLIGYSAVNSAHWQPPHLPGRSRKQWKLQPPRKTS